jgi:phage terminase large subunit-like protein
LSREGTADFPYVFDAEKGDRFLRWVRLFKHRKGILAGKYIDPAPIQKFVFGNIYGWAHMVSGYRRFTKFYWQVARKNAKSQMLACVGTYELAAFCQDGTETMEVYCAATKNDQARIDYDEAVAMVEGCAPLKGKFKEAYHRLVHIKSEGIMRALSKEDRKSGDGLNVQCGIIDEYHAHETTDLYDVIDSGMGARSQPLLGIITTGGFNLSYPCYRVEYHMVTRILDPSVPVELDTYFATVNELETNTTAEPIIVGDRTVPPGDLIDDMWDEATWQKANPIVASYPEGMEFLRQRAAEAKLEPEKLASFKTKHLNVWINETSSSYMNGARWGACGVGRDGLPDLSGADAYVGLDLSARNDLTSIGLEFRVGEKYVCLSHSFIPEVKMEAKRKSDLVDYALWRDQGWLSVTGGEVVDYRAVIQYAKDWLRDLKARAFEWCIDSWGATQIAADLIDEGETVVEIIQGTKTLCEPTKDFRNQVLDGNIIHDGSPVFAWALGNAKISVVDRNENIILNKSKSRDRIDPLAAMINAHVRALVAVAEREPRVFFV